MTISFIVVALMFTLIGLYGGLMLSTANKEFQEESERIKKANDLAESQAKR